MTKPQLYSLQSAVEGIMQNVINVRRAHAGIGGVEPFDTTLQSVEEICESLMTELGDKAYLALAEEG